MITNKVIKEIYKNYKKPCKDHHELQIEHYINQLEDNHKFNTSNPLEIIVEDLDEYNPFRRFLRRSIHAILDLDNTIAFVFRSHILFFGKNDNQIRVHIKPEEESKSFLSRLFGK